MAILPFVLVGTGVKQSQHPVMRLNWSLTIMDIPSFLALNDGHGLLDLSEENLEKMHKVARRLREKKCRLTGPQENLTDLLNRFVTFFIILNSCPLSVYSHSF